MSKDNPDQFKVGYNGFDNLADAQKDATKRALRDWDNTPVYQLVGLAKFDLSKLSPDLVTYETVTQ